MANLNPIFFVKLKQMCKRLGINPADALLVFYQESGLNPSSNTNHTVGLNQFYGESYKKYFSGTKEEYASLPAEDQLSSIEPFFRSIIGGRKILSAAHLYAYNFLPGPASLIKDTNPNFLLAKKDDYTTYPGTKLTYHAAYMGNEGLDVDKDGSITYGDLENKLLSRSREKAFQDALSQLNQSPEEMEDSVEPKSEEEETLVNFISKLKDEMNSTISSFSKDEYNDYLVKISSEHIEDGIELARILATAYEDFLGVKCYKFAEDNNVEIYFINNGDKDKCFAAVEQFSNVLLEEFSNQTEIASVNLKYFTNKKPSYNNLNLKTAEINYRKFKIKMIGNKK